MKEMSFLWEHNRRFNAFSNYIKKRYGGRLQWVVVNAGFTCPNRDGSLGKEGCIYCNNTAFVPSYCDSTKSIYNQLEDGISFLSNRYKRIKGYIAYFQAYTNTYAKLDFLKRAYEDALKHPKVCGLAIGTRPDCINEEILNYLQELAKNYFIFLEFGIESCYDKTLEFINRGHTFEQTVQAIKISAGRGIHIGGQIIFGIPGETREEMLKEAEILSALPINSLKFHQLQIIKGTILEKLYTSPPVFSDLSASGGEKPARSQITRRGEGVRFQLFTLEEYLDFIVDFLKRLNPNILIQRLTAETHPYLIVAPDWGTLRTDVVMKMIEKRLEERNTWQGRCYY